jgi:hypothetical protein
MCQRKPTGDSSGVPGGHIEKCKTLSTTLQEISHCLSSICFAGATYQGSSKKSIIHAEQKQNLKNLIYGGRRNQWETVLQQTKAFLSFHKI